MFARGRMCACVRACLHACVRECVCGQNVAMDMRFICMLAVHIEAECSDCFMGLEFS